VPAFPRSARWAATSRAAGGSWLPCCRSCNCSSRAASSSSA
jgi:hypothetical protein